MAYGISLFEILFHKKRTPTFLKSIFLHNSQFVLQTSFFTLLSGNTFASTAHAQMKKSNNKKTMEKFSFDIESGFARDIIDKLFTRKFHKVETVIFLSLDPICPSRSLHYTANYLIVFTALIVIQSRWKTGSFCECLLKLYLQFLFTLN